MTLLETTLPELLWFLGFASNVLAATLFLTLGLMVLRNLHRSSQLGDNPLGSTTSFIFLLAAGSHGVHALLFWTRTFGPGILTLVVAVDLVLAAAIAIYLVARRRHGASAAIYDDLESHRRALEINDAVVQRLAEAKLALDMGHMGVAYEAVGSSLEQSKRICNDMLAQASGRLRIDGARATERGGT